MSDTRMRKDMYYLSIAEAVAQRSTCLSKHYGAVIVKNDEVIATGYNGSPRGRKNCCELRVCKRMAKGVTRGIDYAMSCRSVHAEMNAIISASRDKMIDSVMYLYGWDKKRDHIVDDIDCCPICRRLVINSGIKRVYFIDKKMGYTFADVKNWIEYDETLEDLEG